MKNRISATMDCETIELLRTKVREGPFKNKSNFIEKAILNYIEYLERESYARR